MFGLALLWVGFGVAHSLMASAAVKSLSERACPGSQRIYRLVFNLIFLIWTGYIFYYLLTEDPFHFLFTPIALSRFAGIALMAVGVVLLCASFFFFDVAEFTGLSYLRQNAPKPKLRTDGFYRYVRHPMYFATFVCVAGFWLYRPSMMNLLNSCFLCAYTYIGALFEERKLIRTFGDAYLSYRKNVKMLVPFVF